MAVAIVATAGLNAAFCAITAGIYWSCSHGHLVICLEGCRCKGGELGAGLWAEEAEGKGALRGSK